MFQSKVTLHGLGVGFVTEPVGARGEVVVIALGIPWFVTRLRYDWISSVFVLVIESRVLKVSQEFCTMTAFVVVLVCSWALVSVGLGIGDITCLVGWCGADGDCRGCCAA